MFQLNEKSELVTGSATGLGQAIAVALASAGATVAISDMPMSASTRLRNY
jgi:NAD(P)-dependent dehydrogenase (short-subunit alcohol dehydrogenase family)